MFLVAYAMVYAFFVVIQVVVFNAEMFGKGARIGFMSLVLAIPFVVGFVPMYWLSSVLFVGRHGLIRSAAGCISGMVAVGGCYGLSAAGWIG
jgi:hypothetical protein